MRILPGNIDNNVTARYQIRHEDSFITAKEDNILQLQTI